jgi:tetratricopeptide (TPR) repeat protein
VIRINPGYAQAYTDRGVIHYLEGRYDQAIADYDQALRLSPGHAPTYYNRASAYRAKGQVPDAIADYRKVLALDPSMMQAKAKLQDLGVSQPRRPVQLLLLTRKITGSVKLNPSSATSGGGAGTGSDRFSMSSAA